jgi:hypothetical protein
LQFLNTRRRGAQSHHQHSIPLAAAAAVAATLALAFAESVLIEIVHGDHIIYTLVNL